MRSQPYSTPHGADKRHLKAAAYHIACLMAIRAISLPRATAILTNALSKYYPASLLPPAPLARIIHRQIATMPMDIEEP
jgi:hypothetical protein